MSADAYSEAIGGVLRATFGERRFADKLIARLADATDRAARNWRTGLCGPHAPALIKLMAREPAVAAAVQQLVDRQRTLDAERRARATRRHPP